MGKLIAGLLLGFVIGALARRLDIPVPAPPRLAGAMLVVSITLGYVTVDRWMSRRPAATAEDAGGPTGEPAE